MSTLTLLAVLLLCVLIVNAIVISVLKKKKKKNVISLISNIIMLPVVPLFWLISREFHPEANKFITLYLPLIITILIIGMLVFRIVKYKENNSKNS